MRSSPQAVGVGRGDGKGVRFYGLGVLGLGFRGVEKTQMGVR